MPTRSWASAPLGATLSGVALIFALSLAPDSRAGVVALGSGWQAEWAPSLDGLVNITSLNFTASTLTISKTATFTQGPVNGIFPSIPIVFRQIGASTVTSIVIEEETLTNSTLVAWSDFHFDLVGSGVSFNPAATAASGPNGFVVSPFTNSVFTPDNQRLDIDGGTVANTGIWAPGAGANGGALVINVTSSGVDTFFTLKETPTPGPTALSVIALGVIMYTPRRRRD